MDFRTQDRTALELNRQVAERLRPDHLDLPTPCPPWSVRELLRHMVGQHLRFGAVARGEDPDAVSPVEGPQLGADAAATLREAAEILTRSFAEGDETASVLLPELGRPVPLGVLISFHFLDFVVHGWDLAVSIGAPFTPPAKLSDQAFQVGQVIPDASRGPGASFAVKVPVGDDADALARLLGLAGRDPDWAPTGG
ncbi:TIGR03086 family protein [Actinospica durhamensis]|uniref:TIGR03086 family protein n=1 Tax=Actinospica durhamensis TaxID=1508375 RepID=A0A941ET01_9ACTN|nr:TIGR03086 family metal-binding protein [Actinospica durhamensis]MBR7837010.1 TIGR03086 family protein [Actinospica durhamensis]